MSEHAVGLKMRELPGWEVVEVDGGKRLEREFAFRDFVSAMAFSVQVGMLAEQAGHHPAILTEWGRVTVTWWSHSLGGLGEKDFEMAEKTSDLQKG